MKRDEAVKRLQATRLMLLDGANQPISDLYYALDMAIEALEQTEPSLEQFRVGLEYHTDAMHFGKAKDESITTDKTENSSEKPNNCEEQKCEDCIWTVCNYNKAFKDEPQTYTINPKEPTNMPKCFDCDDFFTCDGQCDEVEDEPQTDCPWK